MSAMIADMTGAVAFVVDTDTYAGNFEREMVAFMSGRVGECGVGSEDAARAHASLPEAVLKWCETHVTQQPDEHGCYRPASIMVTPGWHYSRGKPRRGEPKRGQSQVCLSVAMWLSEEPPQDVMAHLKERAIAYSKDPGEYVKPMTVTGFRMVTYSVVTESRDI